MININRNNYERYFIDFLDGNLDQTEKEQLFLFLDVNPDLKEELENFDGELIIEGEVSYGNKRILLKKSFLAEVISTNFDELCIANLEGDLNQNEEKYFQEVINEDIKKQKELEYYKLTQIYSDESIVFDEKQLLKKTSKPGFKRNYAIISIAASIVLLIGIYFLLPKQRTELIENPIADVNNQQSNKTVFNIAESIKSEEKVEKIKAVNTFLAKDNNLLSKVKLRKKEENIVNGKNIETIESKSGDINKLVAMYVPIEVDLKFNMIELDQTNASNFLTKEESIEEENYFTVRSFLTYRVFNKKEKLEWFDVAQASVEGINKLTGSSMTLERKYDENGNPDKTEFSSKLIAFSTPAKKDKENL